jgi:hypothetical protein
MSRETIFLNPGTAYQIFINPDHNTRELMDLKKRNIELCNVLKLILKDQGVVSTHDIETTAKIYSEAFRLLKEE